MLDPRHRATVFIGVALTCVTLACLYAVHAARRGSPEAERSIIRVEERKAETPDVPVADRVLFRNTAQGPGYGRVSVLGLSDLNGVRVATSLACDRVDFAAGVGSCLAADRGVFTTYQALIFDEQFNVRHKVNLAGIPSRTRVSPDGRLAAVTVFVSGHSYASGGFSTQTNVIDTKTGTVVADLEAFAVTRDGQPFKAVDFNFWGVTFAADSNTFYATLGTGGHVLLVKGDVAAQTAVVLRDGVECPSLSPDGTRLAFKKRSIEGGRFMWHIATLDLQTLTDRVVTGEQRSVDDQVEWLDAEHLLYALSDDQITFGGTSIWKVAVDVGAPATPWLRGAYSPSVAHSGRP